MIVSLIVAADDNCGIGKNNQVPWHLSSDLKRFRRLTMGHYVVMGRKTYETIGKPLPGRKMIVITHQKDFFPRDCSVIDSLDKAINLAEQNHETECFIIGGGEIFRQSIEFADKIYLTIVHASTDADVFFPKIDANLWVLAEKDEPLQEDNDEYISEFKIFLRKH